MTAFGAVSSRRVTLATAMPPKQRGRPRRADELSDTRMICDGTPSEVQAISLAASMDGLSRSAYILRAVLDWMRRHPPSSRQNDSPEIGEGQKP